MARTCQISKEKRQSIIILRHEGQSIPNISRSFKVSSSAAAKTIKRYNETDSHEERHRKGRPRVTSAAEDKFIRVTSLRNCSPDTSHHQLFRGGCVIQAKFLQRNHYLRTPIRAQAMDIRQRYGIPSGCT